MRVPRHIRVWWDRQDPDNMGWAFELADDDGLIDSGELDTPLLPDNPSAGHLQLELAVVQVANEHGIDIEPEAVHTETEHLGGCGMWSNEIS